jgi:hypothetical protein
LTSGFLNIPWKAAPLAPSAPPTNAPIITLGNLIFVTIVISSGESVVCFALNHCQSAFITVGGEIGYRPTHTDSMATISGMSANNIK